MHAAIRLTSVIIPLVFGARLAAAVDIRSCPAEVPEGEVGVVTADFTCDQGGATHPYHGIELGKRAQLDLGGHTVTLQVGPQIFGVVHCASRCSVNNGRITGGGGLAIGLDSRGRLAATDLTIDNVVTGIEVAYGKVFLTNVSIQAAHFGIYPISRAVLDHVTVTLTDAQPSECIGASQRSAGVSGNDVTVSGCGYGVLGDRKVAITRLTATGSTFGVAGKRVVLKDSTVTGNAIADVVSQKPPRLTNTTCDHSAVYNGSGADDWNVCSAD